MWSSEITCLDFFGDVWSHTTGSIFGQVHLIERLPDGMQVDHANSYCVSWLKPSCQKPEGDLSVAARSVSDVLQVVWPSPAACGAALVRLETFSTSCSFQIFKPPPTFPTSCHCLYIIVDILCWFWSRLFDLFCVDVIDQCLTGS